MSLNRLSCIGKPTRWSRSKQPLTFSQTPWSPNSQNKPRERQKSQTSRLWFPVWGPASSHGRMTYELSTHQGRTHSLLRWALPYKIVRKMVISAQKHKGSTPTFTTQIATVRSRKILSLHLRLEQRVPWGTTTMENSVFNRSHKKCTLKPPKNGVCIPMTSIIYKWNRQNLSDPGETKLLKAISPRAAAPGPQIYPQRWVPLDKALC